MLMSLELFDWAENLKAQSPSLSPKDAPFSVCQLLLLCLFLTCFQVILFSYLDFLFLFLFLIWIVPHVLIINQMVVFHYQYIQSLEWKKLMSALPTSVCSSFPDLPINFSFPVHFIHLQIRLIFEFTIYGLFCDTLYQAFLESANAV